MGKTREERRRINKHFYYSESHSVVSLCDPMDCSPWNSPGQNTGMGSLSLLQQIFPTQESNQGLLHCRQILYQLSHKGSLFIIIPPLRGQKRVWQLRNLQEGPCGPGSGLPRMWCTWLELMSLSLEEESMRWRHRPWWWVLSCSGDLPW